MNKSVRNHNTLTIAISISLHKTENTTFLAFIYNHIDAKLSIFTSATKNKKAINSLKNLFSHCNTQTAGMNMHST